MKGCEKKLGIFFLKEELILFFFQHQYPIFCSAIFVSFFKKVGIFNGGTF